MRHAMLWMLDHQRFGIALVALISLFLFAQLPKLEIDVGVQTLIVEDSPERTYENRLKAVASTPPGATSPSTAEVLQQRANLAPRRPLAAEFESSADSVPVLDAGVADADEDLDAFYLESLEDPDGESKGAAPSGEEAKNEVPSEAVAKAGAPSEEQAKGEDAPSSDGS